MKELSVVIPAYNEEQSIVTTVGSVRDMLDGAGITGEIIVVDDGSDDRTGELAATTEARVLTHSSNRGYGASLKTGIRNSVYETIAITDADGTYPVERIPSLLEALESGADMAVGARTTGVSNIPTARRPAKWVLRKLAAYITGCRIPDLNSGLRVFGKNLALNYFHLLPSGFSFTTTITVASLCDDLEIEFIPIDYMQREGTSKITPTHFPNFVMLVMRLAVLFRPLKIFIPASLFCFVLGIVKLGIDVALAVQQTGGFGWSILSFPVISSTTVILMVSGLQILLFGMVAEAMARRATVTVDRGPRT